jgi:four helix bundle protein
MPQHIMPLRHHSLVAWQRADDLFIKLHELTLKSFPAFERFELGGQLRRAAYSVPANIVEGFSRRYRRSRLHYLNIAEGSLAEVGYCLHAAKRLGYVSDKEYEELEHEIKKAAAPLHGLVRAASTLPIRAASFGVLAGAVGMALFQRLFW